MAFARVPISSIAARIAPAVCIVLLALLTVLAGAGAGKAAGDPQDGVNAEKPRVAFVMGNNAYDGNALPSLKNPINDGKLISGALRRLNFQVIESYDVSLAGMQELFREHGALIDEAEAVVFYFAGHGFQLDGKNFLVPVDASFRSAADIPLQTVQLDAVIKLLENEDRPTLVFLDACRENPLPDGAAVQTEDGLAQIEAGLNTFIAFATEPGNVANGGAGNNSPFAIALAKHLETPGLSISDLTIAVRNETRALTLDAQSPWSQESLRAQFYFTERQELDASALQLAAAEILKSPRQLEAFNEALSENLSFQAAVFRARQRGVEVLGQPDPTNASELYGEAAGPSSTIEIASTAPASGTNLASDAPGEDVVAQLMFTSLTAGSEDDAAPERERQLALARQLQTELQRLGCYRMGVDGIWGPGSRRALESYLRQTAQSSGGLEPTVELLNKTSLSSGRVCRAPVYKKPTSGPKVARRTSPSGTVSKRRKASIPSARQRAVKGTSRGAQRQRRAQRKRALPPDLSAGVGIGL